MFSFHLHFAILSSWSDGGWMFSWKDIIHPKAPDSISRYAYFIQMKLQSPLFFYISVWTKTISPTWIVYWKESTWGTLDIFNQTFFSNVPAKYYKRLKLTWHRKSEWTWSADSFNWSTWVSLATLCVRIHPLEGKGCQK